MAPAPVLSTEELRELETRAARLSPSLMERAGKAIAQAARRLAKDTADPVLVIAGPGNNGGDAWVAAAHLADDFGSPVVLDASGTQPKAPEARAAKDRLRERGGRIVREWPRGLHPSLI